MERLLDILASFSSGPRRALLLALSFSAVGLFMASTVYPFTPLVVEDYRVDSARVCPSGPVQASLQRTWREPNIFRGTYVPGGYPVKVRSEWVNTRTGQIFLALPESEKWVKANINVLSGRVTSPLLRTAPPAPGEYRLVAHYQVRYRTLLFPGAQSLTVKSAPIRVEAYEGCNGGAQMTRGGEEGVL